MGCVWLQNIILNLGQPHLAPDERLPAQHDQNYEEVGKRHVCQIITQVSLWDLQQLIIVNVAV